MNEHEPKVFGLIVAAGVGSRFGADVPKQYLSIGDKTVLEHSFLALCGAIDTKAKPSQNPSLHHAISDCTVVVSKEDDFIKQSTVYHQTHIVIGGAERWQSVKEGVLAIAKRANPKDVIAIHDAARPCLQLCDLLAVIECVKAMDGDCAGAILASPVADTLKYVKEGRIHHTVSRESLWQAQTPQVFFVDKLLKLFDFLDNLNKVSVSTTVTDEASGFEMMGIAVAVVQGSASNIKLTRADDLPLVRAILHEQGRL